MTFARHPKTPVSFLAYNTDSGGEEGLWIQIGVGAVLLPSDDALALADYIHDKFATEPAEVAQTP